MEERETRYEPPHVEDLGTLEEITGAGAGIGAVEVPALKT